MKKVLFITPFFFLYMMFSCIEPINIKNEEFVQQLVVEGEISNLPGPYRINLRYNSIFPEDPNYYREGSKVSNATVTIFEEGTNKYSNFEYKGDGIYETTDPNFRGIIGNHYFIEIQVNNKTYHSRSGVINPVPEIDSLYADYDSLSAELSVFLDFQDFESSGNKYRWKWEGYNKILTSLPGPPDYPDTFDCCTSCFMHDKGKIISTYHDSYTNGNYIKRQKIMKVPLDNSTDYLVEVKQIGLTAEEYDYLNLLKNQIESKGGLFDPLPFNLEGNIYNIDDPSESVLGFFSTISLQEGIIQVKRKPYHPNPNIISNKDCRTIPYAFAEEPENWNQ